LQTIENTREKDETFVDPEDEDVLLDEADDEFAGALGQCHTLWRMLFIFEPTSAVPGEPSSVASQATHGQSHLAILMNEPIQQQIAE